ncbi:MAG: succinylglutamate desuccinylase/aspartoacylase family protein [Ruminococcus sp.]|nr:succinylglutamate desuccinylase/aspartoacylase family protein [Ruminococcus sp.]
MKTIYRENLKIPEYVFGEKSDNPENSVAIVGALRGNEVQQTFICASLVRILTELETNAKIRGYIKIFPCVNRYSMNVGKRFWASDNTDINRMFPGFCEGETKQRVADEVFEKVKNFKYGIQLASFYLPGEFMPHVRIIKTAFTDTNEAFDFGLPNVFVAEPSPFDTATLNYNWQIWNTSAYSLYSKTTEKIDIFSADIIINSILTFLSKNGIIKYDIATITAKTENTIYYKKDLVNVVSPCGGILIHKATSGEKIMKEQVLAEIIDPLSGNIKAVVYAPKTGQIFYTHTSNLISEHEIVYRII